MEHFPDDAPPLVAAPRHLRRKRLRADIPDQLLVPGAEPLPWGRTADAPTKPQAQNNEARRTAYQRKRLVALGAVIVVALSIPALVAALLLVG